MTGLFVHKYPLPVQILSMNKPTCMTDGICEIVKTSLNPWHSCLIIQNSRTSPRGIKGVMCQALWEMPEKMWLWLWPGGLLQQAHPSVSARFEIPCPRSHWSCWTFVHIFAQIPLWVYIILLKISEVWWRNIFVITVIMLLQHWRKTCPACPRHWQWCNSVQSTYRNVRHISG